MHDGDVRTSKQRPGLTLIELLVVMTLILVLATLAVAFIPKVTEKDRVRSGASLVQSWLGTSKEWALRDQTPRGVRLQPDANGLVTVLQYIEQPDDFTGGQVGVSGTTATGSGVDFSGGFSGSMPQETWPVQKGDYLEIAGASSLFRIKQVVTATRLELSHAPVTPIPATSDYRIVRQPRPKSGEAELRLPDNVAIDINTNGPAWYRNSLPVNQYTGTIDILFSPFGEVIGPGSGNDKIQLWLRDTTEDVVGQTFGGEQYLVTVYIRTGMIAANPVDVTPDNTGTRYVNPYSFTQDGRASGL